MVPLLRLQLRRQASTHHLARKQRVVHSLDGRNDIACREDTLHARRPERLRRLDVARGRQLQAQLLRKWALELTLGLVCEEPFNSARPVLKVEDHLRAVWTFLEVFNAPSVDCDGTGFDRIFVRQSGGDLLGKIFCAIGVDGHFGRSDLGRVSSNVEGVQCFRVRFECQDTRRWTVAFFVAVAEETVESLITVSQFRFH